MSVTAPRYFATATVNSSDDRSRGQVDHDRPRDPDSYLALARRACFVCELLASNPYYPHHVAYRDDVVIVFANRFLPDDSVSTCPADFQRKPLPRPAA